MWAELSDRCVSAGVSPVSKSGVFVCVCVFLQTLDTSGLKIVSVKANGQTAQFTMGPKHSFKGTPMDIRLPFDLSR